MQTHGYGHHHRRQQKAKLSSAIKRSFAQICIDRAIYVFSFFGIIFTIPQVMKIWVDRDVQGVSFITWAAYLAAALFWLLYGLYHKEKVIIVSNLCAVAVNAVIVIGLIVIGKSFT